MKVSVIVPCYNAQATIKKCIESILNQYYAPEEIIIIDDGSSDNSKNIIAELISNSYIPIKYYHQKNSGPSVARNFGINKAIGDWIAFLDSDDYWVKDKLSNQVAFLIKNSQYSLLGCGSLKSGDVKDISFDMLLNCNYFQTSSVLVRKEVMLRRPFNIKQKYSEDYLCWLQICFEFNTAIISPKMVFPINKDLVYGGNGLSSKLYRMEKGELSNYYYFLKSDKISLFTFLKVSTISIIKFFRRIIIKFFSNER